MVSPPALSFLLSQTNGELQKKQYGESSAEQAESKALRKESLGCLKTLNPGGCRAREKGVASAQRTSL